MSALAPSRAAVRHRVRVSGVVQGVGFRPFVHRLARELALAGHVGNDSDGVFIEVEGPLAGVGDFEDRLVKDAPPLSVITSVAVSDIEPLGRSAGSVFRIVESRDTPDARTFVSPDVAVCEDCLAEMFDPADRRYRYPFINCTNCGPRFTITVRLPYDRPNTTMSGFALCRKCEGEYHDPSNRRFHAQPVACADCGPTVWFEEGSSRGHPASPGEGRLQGGGLAGTDAAIAQAQRALAAGAIVAVKGLGGYHLACDATSDAAVAELRRRKRRPDKPFAVMVADAEAAGRIALLGTEEARVLTAKERPIVLLDAKATGPLSGEVAPGGPFVGVLLPYSPLHHLLFRPVPGESARAPSVLVMTSGNLADEPICYEDDEAKQRLGPIADCWLVHDRPIHVPCDDSVVRVDGPDELPIRRSRGYTPLPVNLPFEAGPTLATGGELKNTFCLASGNVAWMSQHIGDMGSVESLAAFERSARQFSDFYGVSQNTVVADAHPGYQTRRWAEAREGSAVRLVQHHHAHLASVMAEHGVAPGERVIGFAFDGTGYGTDGAIWGGEVMLAGYSGFERVSHLAYVPLPGGDVTIRKPYRAALAHLRAAGIDWDGDLEPVRSAGAAELRALERQLERGIQCVPTSSMGRLFDAVSSILGLRHVVSYEAQAAIELEAAADAPTPHPHYQFSLEGDVISVSPVVAAIVGDWRRGCPRGAIAAGFHDAVAHLVNDAAVGLSRRTGLKTVALSGGVFQNRLLLRLASDELEHLGLRVLTHRLVPPNDGGLALGQVAIAAAEAGEPAGANR